MCKDILSGIAENQMNDFLDFIQFCSELALERSLR